MRVIAIVQARMGSSRLPGKVMLDVCGRPAIWHLMEQLNYASRLDDKVLATTTEPADNKLSRYAEQQGWNVYRGSEDDVLDRYYEAALEIGCVSGDVIVRITGDDILADPEIIDQVIELYTSNQPEVKHASNNRVSTYPYGSDVEVFAFEALEQSWRQASSDEEREHVTPYIRNNPELFPYVDVQSPEDLSHVRLSIDYSEDLEFNRRLFQGMYQLGNPPFHLKDILRCIEKYDITHQGVPA
ncbi:MAG: glycosyltransferase family protein [Chloroflexi bacterium]|nr:glycosyltransferase family protein [Chloroflexota bacterium]